jgi:putative aldouronate transport system permease protein
MAVVGSRKTPGDYAFNFLNYTVFILFTLACVFPFYYIFINTISDNTLVSRGAIMLYPRGVHLNNYIEVLQLRGIGRATIVSASRTVIGTALTVLASAFVAYIITQEKLTARRFWYRFIIITMYFNAGIIPIYLNLRMLGLLNNFLVYVIPTMVVPFYLILVKTYIESTPPSLQESAKIDGAGYITIFTRIILPISTPILAALGIFSAVAQWNSYLDTLFYVTKSNLYTLQFVLFNYLNELNALAQLMASNPNNVNVNPALLLTPTSIRLTISMVIILPIFFVYPIGQKYFMSGIMLGAVKG